MSIGIKITHYTLKTKLCSFFEPIPFIALDVILPLSERAKEDTMAGRFDSLNDEQWQMLSLFFLRHQRTEEKDNHQPVEERS